MYLGCIFVVNSPFLIVSLLNCRALLFFELTFQEILISLKSKQLDVNMKKIFTSAYEGSVKQYHNWITQQLFHVSFKFFYTTWTLHAK